MKRLIELEVGIPGVSFTVLVGLEARGFILGPILALEFGLPFAAIRKKGKLPGKCFEVEYGLEYGRDCVQIQ